MPIKLTTESFIEKARKIHGDKYDYSLVEYTTAKTKVKIICPVHGVFEQIASNHINNGYGCNGCAGNFPLTTESFIERVNKIHNNKYDYSLVVYKNNHTKINIICKKHGLFKTTPTIHLQNGNCPQCWIDMRSEYLRGRNVSLTRELPDIKILENEAVILLPNYEYTIIDKEDYERVNKFTWSKSKTGYVVSVDNSVRIKLHRFLLHITDSSIKIDHKDRNKLNNKKSNLRLCTDKENSFNKIGRNLTSKYKGVCWYSRNNKWRATINLDRKQKHIGMFTTEIEAAKAYDSQAKQLFKEFAHLNFPNV